MIKFCTVYVLQLDGPLTLEKLESRSADKARPTLGELLGQLRKRVEIDATFDDRLQMFLELRNRLAHNLNEVPGFHSSQPSDIALTIAWASKLSGLAWNVHNAFFGLARAWQEQIGLPDDLASHEFFQEIDTHFNPFVDQVFMAKSSESDRIRDDTLPQR